MNKFVFLLVLLISNQISGQESFGGYPYTLLKESLVPQELVSHNISTKNISQLKSWDLNHGIDNRAAVNIDVDIDFFSQAEKIILKSGASLYLLKVKMRNSQGVSLLIDKMNIPSGARLFFVSLQNHTYQGSFTQNSFNNNLYIDFLAGKEFIIEVYIPKDKTIGQLHINKFYQVYNPKLIGWDDISDTREIGFGTSFECHINSACPEGDPYRDEIDATVRIQMVTEEGISYCTGSMINNTSNDKTPYLLTAEHCIHGFSPLYDQWRFDYHYESQTCEQPTIEPTYQYASGCEFVAANYRSDFLLVKLLNLPAIANTYLSGWNRTDNYFPDTTILIEHPNVDIKKIALDYDEIDLLDYQITWNNGSKTPANSHYRIYFDRGTQQPGASGGPLLDKTGHIIGQLHGGVGQDSTCSVERKDYFGRIYYSWEQNDTLSQQLKHWLDPLSTNEVVLDGIIYESTTKNVSGVITTYNDKSIPNVAVKLTVGGEEYLTYSDNQGNYSIDYVPNSEVPILNFSKEGDITSGLNIADLVKLTRHILFLEPFDNEVKELIADVNDSGSLNIIDIIKIRRVILLLDNAFPNGKSWLFFDNNIEITNEDMIITKAAKMGDVNFSVDPSVQTNLSTY